MRGSSKDNRPFLQLELSATDDADYDRLETALAEIISQEPTVRIRKQLGQRLFILEGRAKADLQSIYDRLRDEYHLAVNVGLLDVVFLETIRKQAEGEGKYIRQTGGSGNYGHCKLRVEPNEPGKGFEFIDGVKRDAIPSEYIKPIEQGIQDAMESGILNDSPVVDVKVTLFGGSYHEVDSNEMAFKFAGSLALTEAMKKASPVLLEPMIAIEIKVPQELATRIRNEISMHRGRVERDEAVDGWVRFRAILPVSELVLSNSPLSEFAAEFTGYEPVSDQGASGDDGIGVPAIKPNFPPHGKRSEAARPDQEE